MASMSQVQDLSTLSRLALESFSSLTEHLSPSSSHYQRLDDIRQRFKIWSGNIGAPHAVQNQRSLEYRVRATPKLKTRLAELLRDVGDDLDECRKDQCSTFDLMLTCL